MVRHWLMMSTFNKVALPLTSDLIDAHCIDPGVDASFVCTVPTRLDQTQPTASGSSDA